MTAIPKPAVTAIPKPAAAAIPKPAAGFVGCDVGKTCVVVFDSRTLRSQTLPNAPSALAAFARDLAPDCLVVCEATGGYEAGLLAALTFAGIAAHRADARKVKAFIRSFGIMGKTDAIDAKALALYGQERCGRLARWQPADACREQLQALVLARRDMVAARLACSNRLQAPGAGHVQAFLRPQLDVLTTQIEAIERQVEAVIAGHAELRQAAATLRGVAGIGATTAAALLALMPELGRLDRRQAASLAGLAPHPRQSGTSEGYRSVKGGRPEVKRALFMAAMSAARYNKTLKTFYEKLIAKGKKKLVALTAVMRKLIVICNARVRDAHAVI